MENERFQDLVLEHLAKLTQENTDIKQDISQIKQDNSLLKQDVSSLKQSNAEIKQDVSSLKQSNDEMKQDIQQVKGSLIRIENEHGEKLRALFDAREVQMDINERILDTLHRIEGKVDRLTLKVSTHDSLLKKAK